MKKCIPVSKPALIGNEKKYVTDCLDSAWISSNGKYIALFERRFAEHLGVNHAIACCNGTVALHLALLALGIGSGDEVIVPTLTYVATANAVKYTGATPVLVDSEPDTWNLDPEKIEALINEKTKAIMPVHLYGHPCDMDPIMEIAKKHGLYVIEDAAEAVGAKYKGRMCGSMADISAFSFYGNKTITTGEGGMVVTNDDMLAEKIRLFKGQGMDPKKRYWFPVVGYNYRMTNIEAAIGLAQTESIEKFLAKRRLIAGWYAEELKGVKGITLAVEKNYAHHSYWMYSVLVEKDYGKTRDQVMEALARNGIETRPFFYPMHVMPVYGSRSPLGLKTAEEVAAKGINLPTYYDLSRDDVKFICDCIRTGVGVIWDGTLKEKILKVRDLESEGKDHVEVMYERPSHRRRMEILLGLMERYVPGGDFLDIGCAEGIYCREAAKFKARKVLGIDVSKKKIERAREIYPELKFMVMDSDSITGSVSERFDFILLTEVLQHILDYSKTLKEAVSLLRDSGHLLISVPNLSKSKGHVFANIDPEMSLENLLMEIGGAGHGRQNAIWKFNTDALGRELVDDYPLEIVEKIPVDTPDGMVKNLWTVFLLRKK